MCVWDGCPMRRENEREEESWAEPPDDAAYEWQGGEPDGDAWKKWDETWDEDMAGPEARLNWDGWFED